MHAGTYGAALHQDALLRWRKPGDVTNVPRMEQAKTGVYDAGSSRWLIDGDFIQLRTVSLSYDLGKVGLKRITANSMSVYVSGENIFMLSRRQGMNVNQEFSGVTSNVYTPARIVTAGVSINF
jgi:hypothetical protein